ncbi:hypothetical protein [Weissella cibaria]|uniref:hypothetical protein n=1 Tax=Weissella cibaria TaxID=137591 RepID=UPI000BFF8335|nr:hypothetical protein [Weissella cibaria]
MVQQVEATLEQYELMIRGVLQAGHVYRRSPDFDDYRQELRLMIAERLMAGETLTTQHNNELFRWLLWRLRDLQRRSKRHEDRGVPLGEAPEQVMSNAAFVDAEATILLADLAKQCRLSQPLQRLAYDLMQYPDDTVARRCHRLRVHRATYNRWLQQLRQQLQSVWVA